jgi:DNA-binding beta-propeller fold protein YncE
MLSVMVAVLVVLLAVLALAGSASAAGPALTPSVVGEPPHAEGAFRFPQALAVTPGGATVFVGDQYSGVVQAFTPDGAQRFTIGSRATRREPGRLGVVGGLAVDRSGHLYVLDAENERVQVFAVDDGRPLAQFGDATIFNLVGGDPATGAGISASGIAVAQATPTAPPVVYVADQGHDRVTRFTLDPATLAPTGPPQFSGPEVDLEAPQGLALDPAGTRLYVADDDHHRVLVLDPATLAPLGGVGSFGTGPGQLQNPYDVAVDAQGHLYVADNLNNRVDVFDAGTLAFQGIFGRAGYGPGVGNLEIVRSVGALTDLPSGGVAVADTANNRVQVFDPTGAVIAAWGLAGRGPGYVTRPTAVAMAPDGGLAVADSFDHRVALIAADGTFAGLRGLVSAITGFAAPGSATGQFTQPSGAAYDAAGNLWVADTGNGRVVVVAPDGAVLRTFTGVSGPLAVAAGATAVYVTDTGGGRLLALTADGGQTVVRSGLTEPAAVAVAADGTPYVADATSVRNATTGTTVAGPGGSATWDHPAGLAFAPDGTLYVAERRPGTADGARIVRRDPALAWDTVATEGSGAGQVIAPAGLAVAPDGGTLYVADTGNDRVLRLDAPGHGPAPAVTLRVTVDGPALGAVTSDLPGIACVTDCRQTYGAGRTVTLTARARTGAVLQAWTGACAAAGVAPDCTLALTDDATAGARFAPAPVAPPPVVAPPPPPPPAAVQIRSARLSAHRLHRTRPAARRRADRRATRATLTVTLTRPATVTVGVLAGRPGRRAGSACLAPTAANRSRARCTRFVATSRRRTLRAGVTPLRLTVSPSFAGAALAPGSYRLAITAVDAEGRRVGPVSVAFAVSR